jgi:hypothetical protein
MVAQLRHLLNELPDFVGQVVDDAAVFRPLVVPILKMYGSYFLQMF